jgi:murein biosynthesis integral membrane protein MurJ
VTTLVDGAPGVRDTPAFAGHSLSVAAWTVVSRVTGLGRMVAIAVVLGPTYLGNTYQATSLVPNLVFEFLTGSLLASILVPSLVRHISQHGLARAEQVARGFLGISTCGFVLAGLVLAGAAPLILWVLALGVSDGATAAAQFDAGWVLLVLFAGQIPLYGLAGIGAAVQNSRGRFALAAAAPVFENVGVVLTLVAFSLSAGGGASLDTIGLGGLLLLGLGSTAAVGLHAAAQWIGAFRAGIRLTPTAGWRDPEVRSIARRYLPSLGYSGLNALRIFGAVVVANSIAGGVVAFTVALAFFQLPIAVGARPVSTAMLPQLARRFHARRLTDFVEELSKGLGLVLFVVVPSAVFYIALSEQLGHAVFVGDGDEGLGAALFAAAIVALAPGILAESSFVLFTTASYAMGDARSPFHAMVTRTVLSVGGMAVALALSTPTLVLACLGAALTLGNFGSAWQLRRSLQASLGLRGVPAAPGVLRDLAASVPMGVAAYLAAAAVLTASGEAAEIAAVLVAALVGFVVFIAAQRLFRAPELVLVSGGWRQLRLGGGT